MTRLILERGGPRCHSLILLIITLLVSVNAAGAERSIAYDCPKPCNRFQILWTGDLCLTANIGEGADILREHGASHTFANLGGLLEADYKLANAECPVTTRNETFMENFVKGRPHKEYRMDPDAAAYIKSVGFNAVGLANNHAFDKGDEGLQDSFDNWKQAGVQTFGAGNNMSTAQEPLIIDTPFGKVGVVNMMTIGKVLQERIHPAGDSRYGVFELTEESVKGAARLARERGAKWLAAFVHWGGNYNDVSNLQKVRARYFADSGYDLVIGHHPHIVQSIERIGKTTVLYSLGNFVFTTPGRYKHWQSTNPRATGNGLLARTFLGPNGFEGLSLTCLSVDNQHVKYQPGACSAEESHRLFESLGGHPLHLANSGASLNLLASPVSEQQQERKGNSAASLQQRKGKGISRQQQRKGKGLPPTLIQQAQERRRRRSPR